MGGKSKNKPKTKWRKVSIGTDTRKGEDQSTSEEAEHQENSEDSSTNTQNGDYEPRGYENENGLRLTSTNEEELFEHLPIFAQTPAGLVHIPQNGYFPFPVVAQPPTSLDGTTPPLAEAPPVPPEGGGGVGGCYVNGLWIPNSELFKYGINPPPSTLSSTLVYHPNVPWVRLRPVPGPPPGGHQHHNHNHHNHSHQHQNHHHNHISNSHHHQVNGHQHGPTDDGSVPPQQLPPQPQPTSIPPNSQYLLYFTRKPPPWYQNHNHGGGHHRDRERGDHNWRRRGHHPSPYWSFNHASVHHNQNHHQAQTLPQIPMELLPPQLSWNGHEQLCPGGGAEEFGALSTYNENIPLEDQQQLLTNHLVQQEVVQQQHLQHVVNGPVVVQQCGNYEPTPYIYPGYSFGQPVFAAPVFPVSKSASESRSSREKDSPSTTRSDEGESSGVAPQDTSSQESSSSRPSLSSVGVTEVKDKEESEPPTPPTIVEELSLNSGVNNNNCKDQEDPQDKTLSSGYTKEEEVEITLTSGCGGDRSNNPKEERDKPKLISLTNNDSKKVSPKKSKKSIVPVKEELVQPSSADSLLLATPTPVASKVPAATESSPESNQAQRSKKKKKRKKPTRTSNDMDKAPAVVAETPIQVNGLSLEESGGTSTAIKPDSLDLKLKEPPSSSVKLSNGELPNFKIDLAGPSSIRSSMEDDDYVPSECYSVLIVSQPFLEFTDNLLRSTLEMARKEITELGRVETTDGFQSIVPKEVLEDDEALKKELASTLASTPLGLNTITSPDGCTVTSSTVERTPSNLDTNQTFAEKLAELVIGDSRQECRQIDHGTEPISLPPPQVATATPLASKVEPVQEEDAKTTATVEDNSSVAILALDQKNSDVERVDEGHILGLVDITDRPDSHFSRLHHLVRPDSHLSLSDSNLVVDGHRKTVDDSSSGHLELTGLVTDSLNSNNHDGNGRIDNDQFNFTPNQQFTSISTQDDDGITSSTPNLERNNKSSHDIFSEQKVIEEFADRMLYEIATKVREEIVADMGCRVESDSPGVSEADQYIQDDSWSEDIHNKARRSSRDFDSLGSEDIHSKARRSSRDFDSLGSEFDRRFSIGSYQGGEKYVDEATANYLAHLLPPSDTMIRETEQELNSLQSRVLGNNANHSIYKLAYDEVITDPSDNEASPYTSLTSNGPDVVHDLQPELNQQDPPDIPPDVVDERILMRKDFLPQRFEILVHEADSMSEAGSEDVELIPHRYESGTTTGEKHIYVNKLSLATELLRTKEELPYDEEFKPVTEEPTNKSKELYRGDSFKPETPVKKGKTNAGFVGDEMPLSVITSGPRASTMSTADSGVQSEEEESGDEVAEEAMEGQKDQIKDATTSEEDQGQSQEGQGQGYRRMGAKTRIGSIPAGTGPWDPCLCCCVM